MPLGWGCHVDVPRDGLCEPRTLIALLLGLAIALIPAQAGALETPCDTSRIPSVATDKEDYGATDTALITGQGFPCGAALSVRVTRPDGSAVSADGFGSPGPDAVTTDASGAFQLSYQLAGAWPDGSFYVGQEGEYLVEVLDAAGVVLAATTFTDSHFRFGHMTWRKVGTRTAEITYTVGFRRSFYGSVTVGLKLNLGGISFGDGSSDSPQYTVYFVDTANDWFLARAVVTRTYNGDGPFTAVNSGCCRVSFLSNSRDTTWRVRTVVDFRGSTSGAPVSQLPAIVDCPSGGTCTFNVPGTQPNLHNMTFRLASSGESNATQPTGASINAATGLYSLKMSVTQ